MSSAKYKFWSFLCRMYNTKHRHMHTQEHVMHITTVNNLLYQQNGHKKVKEKVKISNKLRRIHL